MRKQADEAAALNEKLRAARAKAQFVRPYFARALYALILVLVVSVAVVFFVASFSMMTPVLLTD